MGEAVPSPAALQSLLFDSGLFDCDEFSLDSHQQVPQHQQGEGQKQALQPPPMASDKIETQFDLDSDAGDEDNKLKERMNKKKNREKQRRM
jgi:hypothetical protein